MPGGRIAEAARSVNPREATLLAELADAYSMVDRRTEARAAAVAVERLGATEADPLFTVACAYEQIGDRERALAWLERALDAGYPVEAVERSPTLAALRQDRRYVRFRSATR